MLNNTDALEFNTIQKQMYTVYLEPGMLLHL